MGKVGACQNSSRRIPFVKEEVGIRKTTLMSNPGKSKPLNKAPPQKIDKEGKGSLGWGGARLQGEMLGEIGGWD